MFNTNNFLKIRLKYLAFLAVYQYIGTRVKQGNIKGEYMATE